MATPKNRRVGIGTIVGTADSVTVDGLGITDSRLLICANSGGGKSYALRGIVEQLGSIPTIILDPEGEFGTLREHLDMVLVGPGGEVAADPRGAKLLARKLVELHLSAVIDLSDLSLGDRRRFVRIFLESLLALPRKLWHPTLIVVDEAHKFCPERGSGQAESTDAVISLMAQGRKRGFGGCLATQRLSKLHKDAVGECNNVMIGRCVQDVDLKRAGDILGQSKADRGGLRTLKPGEFFAFGPAFGHGGIRLFRTRKVTTTHPTSRTRASLKPTAPSAKIKKVLGELADLPAQEAEEAATLAGAQARVREKDREIRKLLAEQAAGVDPKALEDQKAAIVRDAVVTRDKEWAEAWEKAAGRVSLQHRAIRDELANMPQFALPMAETRQGLSQPGPGRGTSGATGKVEDWRVAGHSMPAIHMCPRCKGVAHLPDETCPDLQRPLPVSNGRGDAVLRGGGAKRKVMVALAQYAPKALSKTRIGALTGLKTSGGHFGNTISELRKSGWLEGDGSEPLRITPAGVEALGHYVPLPTGAALVTWWQDRLGSGVASRVFHALVSVYPESMSRDVLAGEVGATAAGGHFGNSLSDLRRKELITGSKMLRAADELFE